MSRKKSDRLLNGYLMVYSPDYHAALTSNNWKGYVHYHLIVAEKMLGRHLRDDEEVHHLDGDPLHNKPINIIVLPKSMHHKLHAWFARGAPGIERFGIRRTEHISARAKKKRGNCVICDGDLTGSQKKYCSNACKGLALRRTKRPMKATLVKDIQKMSWSAIGRKYSVSDNAVRKWAKNYDLL